MAKIRELVNKLREERAIYHEKSAKYTAAEISEAVAFFKDLNQEIVDALTDGAKDCPDCITDLARVKEDAAASGDEPETWSPRPHGIFHDGTAKPFEIGCLHHANHRVRESLLEDAVERWNKSEYDPPREPGTAVATHRDATGLVKSQRTVKVQATRRV